MRMLPAGVITSFASDASGSFRAWRDLVAERRRAGLGGGKVRLAAFLASREAGADLDLDALVAPDPEMDLLALDAALDRLAQRDPQKAKLVELRYFAGFSNAEAAPLLGISPRKASQVWAYARAWLRDALGR